MVSLSARRGKYADSSVRDCIGSLCAGLRFFAAKRKGIGKKAVSYQLSAISSDSFPALGWAADRN
jgi:hypothetical protein